MRSGQADGGSKKLSGDRAEVDSLTVSGAGGTWLGAVASPAERAEAAMEIAVGAATRAETADETQAAPAAAAVQPDQQ